MQENINLNWMFYPSRSACSSPRPWKAHAENQTWYYATRAMKKNIGSGCSWWKWLVSVVSVVTCCLFPCMLTWFTGSVLPCRAQILHRGRRGPVCSLRCSNVVRYVRHWWWWTAFIRYMYMIYCRKENNESRFILQEENDYSRRAQSKSSTETCKSISCSRGNN